MKGKKGELVVTGGGDREAISRGIFRTYNEDNLRYSQLAPLTAYEEKNTGTNLPAEIEIESVDGDAYKLLFMAKGGGSANKSLLFQETKALLNPSSLMTWLDDKLRTLGTAACPPYHLALVIGGTSAEYALKTAKLASARYLDSLPETGNELGRGFRDRELEKDVLALTQAFGIGAQFGGKYFCHDVRVIRLPRHGASCPVALAVSCSADRQALGKITAEGVFLEQLETDPGEVPPRRHARRPRSRARRQHRSHAADGADPRDVVALSGEDPRDVERPDGGGARHRARQDQGTARRGRRHAAVPQGLLRVLRGPGQDPRRLRVGFVRADDRRAAWTPTSISSRRTAARS